MNNNAEYWTKRFEGLEEARLLNDAKYVTKLQETYEKALSAIKKEINSWLVRFAVNNQISLKEAKKWLNVQELKELKWDVNDYIKHGQENGIDLIWKKELESASAKFHISRLEALEMQIQEQIEELYYNEEKTTNEFIIDSYKDTYYKTAYEIQKGNNVGFRVAALDLNVIQNMIAKPWTTDEQTFSDRIWKNKKALVDTLQTDLTQSIILGEPPDKIIDKIAKDFKVSKNKAGTLVMTESAFFSSVSRKECFKNLGVEKYSIVATLDSRTSEKCRDLDGQVFEMKDYKEGITAPPFHVRCRTTTAPYFEDEYEFGERAARDPLTGKTYYIPNNITYKEWLEKYVNSDPITKKAFETDIKMRKNKLSDYKQYEKYRDVLADETPKTFAKFQEMKYNNIKRYEELKDTYQLKNHYDIAIGRGDLSPLVGFKNYKKMNEDIKNSLVGRKITNGIEIKSYSKHFVDRVFGSVEQKRSGVALKDICKTIDESNEFKISKKNGSIKIIGRNNIVSINPETGNLIQTNPCEEEI